MCYSIISLTYIDNTSNIKIVPYTDTTYLSTDNSFLRFCFLISDNGYFCNRLRKLLKM